MTNTPGGTPHTPDRTVLVLGATGKTGRLVVPALEARGARVRAAGRHPERIRASAAVEPVRFDWADRTTWARALDGADSLYVVGPYAEPDADTLLTDLLAAAAEVRHVVLLSVLGADRMAPVVAMPVWERAVRESGKAWTVLRPNWFQQNFALGFGPALREAGTLELPAAGAALSFVDVRDVAEAAAVVLTEDGHEGRIYDLTGPEALTHAEALATVGSAADRELTYTALSPEAFADRLRSRGAGERAVGWQLELFAYMRVGGNARLTDTVERLTGSKPRTLAAFAAEYASTWRA